VHDINHRGKYFNVPAFALCEPSPQRTPVIFQAGVPPRAATRRRSAEAVFVNAVSIPALKRQVEALRGPRRRGRT